MKPVTQLATVPASSLAHEHRALLAEYGAAQMRCSTWMAEQTARIESLEAEVMRLRAAVIQRDTAQVFAREERAALETLRPGLSRRSALARGLNALKAQVQTLMSASLNWQWAAEAPSWGRGQPNRAVQKAVPAVITQQAMTALEVSLAAADLVICQTGCLSHGAYWRVKNHCKRTGKTCLLVTEPEAMRIVRIHRNTLEGVTALSHSELASACITADLGQV